MKKSAARAYNTNRFIKRQIRQLVLLILLLIAAVVVFATSTNRHIHRELEQVVNVALDERLMQVRALLFKENPYLAPDNAYLAKICNLFYDGPGKIDDERFTADERKSQDDILLNIQKGVQYSSSSMRSTYLMLEDEAAEYVVVNGHLIKKKTLTDTDWMASCRRMRQDVWVEWRTMPLSYLRSAEVVSVYRRITSAHWAKNENVAGYWVLNLDRTALTNAISALFTGNESVYFYNESLAKGFYVGEEDWQKPFIESLVKREMAANGRWQGKRQGHISVQEHYPIYYQADQSFGNFLIIAAKVEDQLNPMLTTGYQLLVGILLLCCVIILGMGIANLRHYRNFDQSLRKILMTNEVGNLPGDVGATPAMKKDINWVVDRLLQNTIDVSELEAALQSEKELKTELQLLYGHVQINSHFLLNTLDSIYWASVRNNGVDSDESVMIEDLCVILKYALDSSGLFSSLREEAESARLYLDIISIRRQTPISAKWSIPEELMDAKVSKLIMQPVVENCIQHASAPNKPLSIRVEAREENGVLILTISDNGEGMKHAEMARFNEKLRKSHTVHSRHIGLSNVNRRIQVQYGPGYGIALSRCDEGGLCVTVRMPYARYIKTGL